MQYTSPEHISPEQTSDKTSALDNLVRRAAHFGGPLAISMMVLVGDFEVRWIEDRAHEPLFFLGTFLAALLLSLTLWSGLALVVRGSKLRRYLLPALVVPFGVLVVASWRFRTVRHFDPTAAEVAYVLQKPAYAFELASSGGTSGWLLVMIALPLSWLAIMLYASSGPALPSKWRAAAGAAVLAVPVAVGAILPSNVENPWMPYPSDIRLLKVGGYGIELFVEGADSLMIEPTRRREVAPAEERERPSVLVVLAESVRNDRTELWGSPGRQTTPNLAALAKRRPGEVFVYQNHAANAAATHAAGVGVILGKHFAASVDVLREAPTIWQYAQAAGMETFVVSAQPWDWSNLTGFYIDNQPPEHFYDVAGLGLDVVNDAGGDDLQAADKVVEIVTEELPEDEPFFGIFQLNATHFPYHGAEKVPWAIDDAIDQYDASLVRSDAAVGKVLDALAKTGRLDSTVVIFVSDHAIEMHRPDYQDGHGAIRSKDPALFHGARVSSCEPVFVRTPMMMFIPKTWQQRLGLEQATLAQNTRRATSHVDLLTTVLELWKMDPALALDGQSLLEPLDPDRLTYCFVPSGLSELRGVGIHGTERYVYVRANLAKPYTYDLTDPLTFEKRRLGKSLEEGDLQLIERACADSPYAAEILGELGEKFELGGKSCH